MDVAFYTVANAYSCLREKNGFFWVRLFRLHKHLNMSGRSTTHGIWLNVYFVLIQPITLSINHDVIKLFPSLLIQTGMVLKQNVICWENSTPPVETMRTLECGAIKHRTGWLASGRAAFGF